MPERDYSHRSLADKLGIKPGQRIGTINVENEPFLRLIARVSGAMPAASLRGMFDIIFLQIDEAGDLVRIAPAAKHLKPAGALWVLHPKGKGAAVKDVQVRAVYLDCGLVDNKVSAYTDTHTATRCVIPVSLRNETLTQTEPRASLTRVSRNDARSDACKHIE